MFVAVYYVVYFIHTYFRDVHIPFSYRISYSQLLLVINCRCQAVG